MHLEKQQLKTAMLPIALIGGAIFYKWLGYVSFLSPYLIFAMLFITYCKINIREIKPSREHLILLCSQMALSAIIYFLAFKFNHTTAEGLFICVFVPTATAAPVITSMLGGKISFVATYSLLCNLIVAVLGPFIFAAVGDNDQISFLQSALLICKKVFPLLLCPLAIAVLLRKVTPKLHSKIENCQQLSFYLWALSLFIIVGNCVSFTINNWDDNQIPTIIQLIVGALIVCLIQFWLGRKIGGKFKDKVSGGQSFGQKNTVLAVWISMAYMTPTASIAPAAYIAWQNIVNSWQLMRHKEKC